MCLEKNSGGILYNIQVRGIFKVELPCTNQVEENINLIISREKHPSPQRKTRIQNVPQTR